AGSGLYHAELGIFLRADPDASRYGAEFPDLGIRHVAVMAKIGRIAKRRICQRGPFQNLATRANLHLAQFNAWMNEGFGDFRPRLRHAGAPLRDTRQNAQKRASGQLDGSASYPARVCFLDLAQYACPAPWHDAKAEVQFGAVLSAAQHNRAWLWGVIWLRLIIW
ncbi:MAG: hypothetical protein ACKPB8_01465, partial [Alphaproteobacteria bacterium]